MSQITQGMLDSCNYELARGAGVRMPEAELRALIDGDADLFKMLTESYPDATGKGFDTYDRHDLTHAFAVDFLGLPNGWPINNDPAEAGDHFLEAIAERIKEGRLELAA